MDDFVSWLHNHTNLGKKEEFHPSIEKGALLTKGYIAEKSGHSRGSALDVTLIDIRTGQVLDMGSDFDFFDETSWATSLNISETQCAHRLLLQQVMLKYGFLSCPYEWWHFTLKNETFPDTNFDFDIEYSGLI